MLFPASRQKHTWLYRTIFRVIGRLAPWLTSHAMAPPQYQFPHRPGRQQRWLRCYWFPLQFSNRRSVRRDARPHQCSLANASPAFPTRWGTLEYRPIAAWSLLQAKIFVACAHACIPCPKSQILNFRSSAYSVRGEAETGPATNWLNEHSENSLPQQIIGIVGPTRQILKSLKIVTELP